jgi:hypothetical protein
MKKKWSGRKKIIFALSGVLIIGLIALSLIKVDKPNTPEISSSNSTPPAQNQISLPIAEGSQNVAAIGINYVFQGKAKSYEKVGSQYKLTLDTPNKDIPIFVIHDKVMVFTYSNKVGTPARFDQVDATGKMVTVFTNYNTKSGEWAVGRLNIFEDEAGSLKQ